MNNRFEILAPAGDFDNLKAAVFAGADSVYLGVQNFNARASATNFDWETLSEAVKFCHARNVTVNVTLNTILYDTELESFADTVKNVAECGVDAVILQDMAAAKIVKEIAPSLARHGSTQMAVHTLEGAVQLKEMGFTRVILARECSFEKIKYITENCGIETEVFIHGALCVCLSGQCYASTFLGGRSGNRGRCAGTCRLPFSAKGPQEDYHLSLKDLCAVDMIKQLKDIGVKCVKIEGRLRTPEYVAGAVDACRKAVNGESFDKQMLRDTFSRSGFTNNYIEGKFSNDIFGVRTKEDSQRTKEVLPQLRQLYRREGQYVPVDFAFTMGETSSALTISDGKNQFEVAINEKVQDSQNDYAKSLSNALAKLGGTPFYLDKTELDLMEGKYLPLAAVNEARHQLVQQLLDARSTKNEYEIYDYKFVPFKPRYQTPKLIARFENYSQIPQKYADKLEYIIVPIENLHQPETELYKDKIVLELTRDMFNGTQKLRALISAAGDMGIDRFCVQNIGHLPLVKEKKVFSSFTLNVSNSVAAQQYKELGVDFITLSPEITLENIRRIDHSIKTIVYGYGYIPLMLTKSCPISNIRSCDKCDGKGWLTDRKGVKMPVVCHGKAKGYREIFNSVPVYMGDRKEEIASDYISLNFTVETQQQAEKVIEKFINGEAFGKDFTRGLYYKGSI
ncbi:MAG: U32 family peptidase [Oscillospiraceae bacterium]|nr:U32 family peptidase [Oscillospiraceae bacterium]